MQFKSINEQLETFIYILKQNKNLMVMLDYISELNLPNFYMPPVRFSKQFGITMMEEI